MSMELDVSALKFSRLIFSNSSFYFPAVSNLIFLLVIIFSGWFSEVESFDEISVIWSDMGCSCISIFL